MKKKLIIGIICFIVVVYISSVSNAGMEIKDGTTAYTGINISEAFEICYNLRDGSSTLGNCELDPHLTTSLDWGAVAYLAHSRYGANSSNVGINTTGNMSGILKMNGDCFTTTILESRKTIKNLEKIENAINTPELKKYIDIIPNNLNNETTRGRAISETYNWYGTATGYMYGGVGSNSGSPVISRQNIFGYGDHSGNYPSTGAQSTQTSFRPVIWN